MGNMMARWFQMIAEGGMIGLNVKLLHSHTITTDYTTTLQSLYTNEIVPYVTFGDYHKLCICVFEGNTTTLSGKIDAVYFSLAENPASIASNAKNGGMIRSGYTNIRSFDTSNDARCAAGTVLKIYTIDF